MLTKRKKENIIKKLQADESDTGSPEVQVGLLTKQIDELTSHLKKHKKDLHSRRGLIGMVARRRKMLNYLGKKDEKRYKSLIKKLGLKK